MGTVPGGAPGGRRSSALLISVARQSCIPPTLFHESVPANFLILALPSGDAVVGVGAASPVRILAIEKQLWGEGRTAHEGRREAAGDGWREGCPPGCEGKALERHG